MKGAKIFLDYEWSFFTAIFFQLLYLVCAVFAAIFREFGFAVLFALLAVVLFAYMVYAPEFHYIEFTGERIRIRRWWGKEVKSIPQKEINVALCMKNRGRGGIVPALAFSPYPYYQNYFTGFRSENRDCYVMVLDGCRLRKVLKNLNKKIRTDEIREEDFVKLSGKSGRKTFIVYADMIDEYNKRVSE